MNILFYTTNEVAPQYGGVERITDSLVKALTSIYQAKCYSAYKYNLPSSFDKTSFVDSIKISSYRKLENLIQFIEEHQIDVIINQGEHKLSSSLREAVKNSKRPDCQIFFALHVTPSTEIHFITLDAPKKELKEGKHILKNLRKFISFPYQKLRKIIKLPKLYKQSYLNCDKFILLSKHFKEKLTNYAHIKDESKIIAIPNALSFNYFLNKEEYEKKQKEVLIVSRLEEEPKRISLALEIWRKIEAQHDLKDWKLRIVGHGSMLPWYQSLVKKYHLQNVSFEGIQNPERYYKAAALFMMTSSFEGWGLTLTEAQQNGCIPLAFNTFSSIKDIITHQHNGVLIPEKDISAYAEEMMLLMRNHELRKSIAFNAIEDSRRYAIENVAKQWMDLLNDAKGE